MTLILPLTIIIALSWLAFRQRNAVMFMILYGVAMITSFYIPDVLGGITALTISLTAGMIIYAFVCAGQAFNYIFCRIVEE